MPDKVEVYVKTEKKLVGQHFSGPVSDGVMVHTCLNKKMLEYEKELPQAQKEVLAHVNNLAEKRGLIVEVIDVSTFKGKLKAGARGVNTTPVVVIGRERVEGFNLEQLKEKLESHFKKPTA